MIADSFDNRKRSAVSNRKAFAGTTVHVKLSRSRPIQDDVSADNVVFGLERASLRGLHDNLRPGKPLADVVVRFAFEFYRQTVRTECAKTLTQTLSSGV